MPLDAPFTLGPFAVDAAGRLWPAADRFPGFRVRWRDCPLHVRLAGRTESGGTLAIEAILGRVPSTGAAGEAALRREDAFAAIRAVAPLLPPSWRLRLLPDHRAAVAADLPLALPASAIGLVAEVARFLLLLAPYRELLSEIEAGLEPAPGAG